jgi:hypothetical protein
MERLCLADISGPFFSPDRPFRNWSAFPYYQTDLQAAPFVDIQLLEAGLERAKAQLICLRQQGYTGIVIDNLAHLVNFATAPEPLYPGDSPFYQRPLIYRAAFGELFALARALGMEVFVTADMQWSTPPLREEAGILLAANQRLATINQWALDELFSQLPDVQGLVIRIGEAGGAHDQGEAYMGHMIYTSPAELRSLIATLLPVCEAHNRLLIVRTWSIGIGDLGDLLWSPEHYQETFAGFESPHLLVSIKHGPADFFRFLPPNPTLGLPGPQQIVELQNRREYELFGMVPSSVIDQHRAILRHNQEHNPHFAGIWAWNSTGGWGGGTAAIGPTGWSFWTELSSALTAALFHNPDLDADAFVRQWCADHLAPCAPLFASSVADFYLASGSLIEQGWYGGGHADGPRTLGGIYLPPLLWVWWMRPTASLLIWATLAANQHSCAQTIAAGAAACAEAQRHLHVLLATASTKHTEINRIPCSPVPMYTAHPGPSWPPSVPAVSSVAETHTIIDSARYLASVLEVAQALRALLLPALAAVWAGQREEWVALKPRMREAASAIARHRAIWAGRTDLPALELDEVAALVKSMRRNPGLVWRQARIACTLVRHFREPRTARPHLSLASAIAVAALLGTLVARRNRLGLVGTIFSLLLMTPFRQWAISQSLPWLNQHLRLLPSIFFETGPALKEWAS